MTSGSREAQGSTATDPVAGTTATPGVAAAASPVAATPAATSSASGGEWVESRIGPRGYRTEIEVGPHLVLADEPTAVGGTNAGPSPYGYLLGALGGCTAMTLRMYADRRGWPLEGVVVRLRTARSYADDCARCETGAIGPARLEREVELAGPLTAEQRARLLAIADRCPIKQTLERGVQVVAAGQRDLSEA